MAQWERVGPITQRSLDWNQVLLRDVQRSRPYCPAANNASQCVTGPKAQSKRSEEKSCSSRLRAAKGCLLQGGRCHRKVGPGAYVVPEPAPHIRIGPFYSLRQTGCLGRIISAPFGCFQVFAFKLLSRLFVSNQLHVSWCLRWEMPCWGKPAFLCICQVWER